MKLAMHCKIYSDLFNRRFDPKAIWIACQILGSQLRCYFYIRSQILSSRHLHYCSWHHEAPRQETMNTKTMCPHYDIKIRTNRKRCGNSIVRKNVLVQSAKLWKTPSQNSNWKTMMTNDWSLTEKVHLFLITLWGMFGRFSLVGGVYQHKRLN